MKRILAHRSMVVLALATLALATPAAWAGSPHFVSCNIVSISGTCLTVAAKEAGLGDEAQISVALSAEAQCINSGGNNPNATNKAAVAANAVVPVQNGKSNYTLTGCATFQPSCSPPMTVVFVNITVTDTTNSILCRP